MLTNAYISFYESWTKNENIELSNIFNKFTSLFIIYNSLYNQLPTNLIEKIYLSFSPPKLSKKPLPDNVAATKSVIKELTAKKILENLNNNNKSDLDKIVELIRDERFFIQLDYGTRDANRASDLKLLEKIELEDDYQKAFGILKVIYCVRCNLFHGEKQMKEAQRELLEPLIRILQTLNNLLFEHLNNIS